jgi:hypothetical protein
VAKFDGGLLSLDGGILMVREIEKRLRIADRRASCIDDPHIDRDGTKSGELSNAREECV